MNSKWVDIEVEVGSGVTFEIVEKVNSFWVSYDPEDFEGWSPSTSSLRWVVGDIKKVMKDLNIQVVHFALHLMPAFMIGGLSNPTCVVGKRKEVIYLRLPIDVVHGQLGINAEIYDDLRIFYHELMHAKDVLEGRFPSAGFINSKQNPGLALITSLWHFSIEGRLEKSGKPHRSQQNAVQVEYDWATSTLEEKAITKEFFQKACDRLWGKEVTFQELQSYLKAFRWVH